MKKRWMNLFAVSGLVIILGMAVSLLLLASAKSGVIKGTVMDPQSKKPVAGAVIRIIETGQTATTDSTGMFEFSGIRSGKYNLEIRADQYQLTKLEKVEIKTNSETALEIPIHSLSSSKTAQKVITPKDVKIKTTAQSDDIKKELDEILEECLPGQLSDKEIASGQASRAAKSAQGRGVFSGAGSLGGVGGGGSVTLGGSIGYLNPPNGAKYWDMYHNDYGTNPFIDTDDDQLSTFGADVSTGSYSLVRNYVNHQDLPPKDAVRVEEFVNYFKHEFPAPDNKIFAVYTESMPSNISKNCKLVKISLKGKEIKAENRKPANLTFVIDISGSMGIENRLGLVKKTMLLLTKELKSGDRVGIVTYGSHAQIVLKHTSDKEKIENAVQGLFSEGSTNAEAGLWKGYQLAADEFENSAINRVILCTDGVVNNGETSSDGLLKMIEKFKNKGITLTACGFGMGNYNDVLIEQLATKGDGTYYYIDDIKEAKRVFIEQLTGTLQVIAKDVKIQVEFDKETVSRYRLIGYEKRDIKDTDFRNDKVDAGEIGSGHSVTAFYEVKLKNEQAQSIGKIAIRYKSPDGKQVDEFSETLILRGSVNAQNEAHLKFLSNVVLYAEIMRESYWVKRRELAEVKTALNDLPELYKKNYPQYEDFYDMVKQTIRLKENKDLGSLQNPKED